MIELINNLRNHAEWAEANEWEVPLTLGDNLNAAADAIEELTAKLAKVTREKDAAVWDVEFLMRTSKERNSCLTCRHREYCFIYEKGIKTLCWAKWRGVKEEAHEQTENAGL